MKKILKRLFILISFTFILISFNQRADATSISFSNNTPTVGESVTITVSVPDVNTVSLTADVTGPGIDTQIKLVNGDMSGNKNTFSNSTTVTPTGTGTISVSITSDSNAVADGNYVNVSASASATVSEAAPSTGGDTGSSNDTPSEPSEPVVTAPTLSNLGINPHDFTGFRSGTTSYSVTVPNDCTSVTIYATSNNGTVTGTGAVTLREGTNRYTVTVSNSAGSKDYTLSIIRRTAEEETIPNVTEEETENESDGIGLTGLRITGYTFEEEFQTEVYEYTVKIAEGLTESELEDIKNSITAITNDESVNVEIVTTLNEDGSAVITLTVKDDEREYSTYTINFVIDETAVEEVAEETSEVAGTTRTNNSQGETVVENITRKMLILLVCMIAIILIAVYYAINAYMKSKRLPKDKSDKLSIKYDDNFDDEDNLISSIYKETNGRPLDYKKLTNIDEEEEAEGEVKEDKGMKDRISEMLKDDNKIPEYSGGFEKSDNELEVKKDTDKDFDEKLNSYRKFRKGFGSGGKH